MSELPPDLPRLRTLETWLTVSLDRVRARIAEVETREAALRPVRQRREEPGWVLAYLREQGRRVPDSVHIDDCRMAGKNIGPLTREEARQILHAGQVQACAICRPDSDLGLID
ncbi:DUF6233 domain-containing protein [Streptomyces sp. NPDC002057]|uniref:DUF6233 domain-containing protein n=1 Tax=Streptomyces sp. NPDC002057 TaxID=3154664 RepID=UPI00332D1229